MFDWEDLKVFLVAYRAGGIGRAAEVLGVSGSTVSRRLSALEEALGQALFVRSPDGLKPTDAARKAWSAAQGAERAMTGLETILGAHDDLKGSVRVSLSSEIMHNAVLPFWSKFSAAYPNICVEFLQSSTLADLERWEADIAIRTVRPPSTETLVITRLRDSFGALFAARTLVQRRGLDPDDQAALRDAATDGWVGWPWIDWVPSLSRMGFAQARESFYPDAKVVIRLENLDSIRLAASAGIGLAFLPRFIGLVSPALVEVPSALPESSTSLFLVSHRDLRAIARVDAVWRFLDETFRGSDDAQVTTVREALTDAYCVTYPAPRPSVDETTGHRETSGRRDTNG